MNNIIRKTIIEINLKKDQLYETEKTVKLLNKISESKRKWCIEIRTLPNSEYTSQAINQWKLLPILIEHFENRKIEAEEYLMGMLIK